eukprot:m.303148 g.303148  ORF g.303148 m.303148 type:complete len:391 (+) comp20160_c0_seq1:114-1286(+)
MCTDHSHDMGRTFNFTAWLWCSIAALFNVFCCNAALFHSASDARNFQECAPYLGVNVSEELWKQLGLVSQAFETANVPFMLFAGTLLGVMRDNGINPYEVDCDIMVDENFTITNKTQDALHSHGLHAFWYKGDIRICNRQQKKLILQAGQPHLKPIFLERLHRPWIDVYRYTCCCPCWEHEPVYRNHAMNARDSKITQSARVQECCTQKPVPKPERKVLQGIVTYVPARAATVASLTHYYGDWMRPPVINIHNDTKYYFNKSTSSKMKKTTIRHMYRNRRKYNICDKVMRARASSSGSTDMKTIILDKTSLAGILQMVHEVHPQSQTPMAVEECLLIFGELGYPISMPEMRRAIAGRDHPDGISITSCIKTLERFLGVVCTRDSFRLNPS